MFSKLLIPRLDRRFYFRICPFCEIVCTLQIPIRYCLFDLCHKFPVNQRLLPILGCFKSLACPLSFRAPNIFLPAFPNPQGLSSVPPLPDLHETFIGLLPHVPRLNSVAEDPHKDSTGTAVARDETARCPIGVACTPQ